MRNLGTSGSTLQKRSGLIGFIVGCMVASAVGAHGPYVSLTRSDGSAVVIALKDANSAAELKLSEVIASGAEATQGPGRVDGFSLVLFRLGIVWRS